MHINVYVLQSKREYYADDPIDYSLQAYLTGVDYIDKREVSELTPEKVETLRNVMMENIKEFNEHLRKAIEEYEKYKDPEKVYFNTTLRYHIDVMNTGHILTHAIYVYEDDMIVPLTKKKLRDISKNPSEYVLLVYDVHY